MAQVQTYGAVFTRRWVVDAMLDLCGYTPDADLGAKVAIEPACGDGAFLLPMVERLLTSLERHGRDISEAIGAIRACDLQGVHVERARRQVVDLLADNGRDPGEADEVTRAWIRESDYLLAPHGPEADFVIGNPPYIRSEDLVPRLRAEYLVRCKTMTPGSDIFVGFIEKGLVSLRPGGVLCYVVADRWQHNSYGRKLRRMVVDDFSVETMLEMHGVDAFDEEVSAYPAITVIRRAPQSRATFVTAQPSFDPDAAARLVTWVGDGDGAERVQDADFRAARLPGWFDNDDVWPSGSPARLSLIEELNERCRPLEDPGTGTKVGIGIATGADKVFLTTDAEAVEAERMLPIVTTGHIRTGHVDWSPAVWLVDPWGDQGQLVDLERYPMLREHFQAHEHVLKGRHIARDTDHGWYRTIDKVQPGLAARPKLLLQDMKATIQPVFDEGHYPHHNLYWVTSTAWDLHLLGGILLSGVAQMFVEAYGVKMRGGTLRFQAQYLRKIRVPDPDSIDGDVAHALERAFVTRDARAATEAALAAYGLGELPD